MADVKISQAEVDLLRGIIEREVVVMQDVRMGTPSEEIAEYARESAP